MAEDGVITPTLFTGTLSIDGVLLHTAAWDLPDLGELWFPATVRGADRVISGAPGVIPYRRRATVTTRSLRMIISGVIDGTTGEPFDFGTGDIRREHQAGLRANLLYLRANVVDPTGVGDGTRTASLTPADPAGATVTAPVHVLGLTPGAKLGPVQRATLDLSFPMGALVP